MSCDRSMRRTPTSRRLGMLALVSSMTLTACSTIPTTAIDNSIPCVALEPITFSARDDTQETIRQVREFNAVYLAICR